MTEASLAEVVAAAAAAPAGDLLSLTAALIAVPSVSLAEEPLVDAVEARLRRIPGLDVERIGVQRCRPHRSSVGNGGS